MQRLACLQSVKRQPLNDEITAMQRLSRIALVCLVAMLPPAAIAAAVAQREFAEATRLKPNTEHGRELFQTCSKCHGSDGAGSRDIGTPEIAGQHFRVLVKQLVDYQNDTRWDIRMESIVKQHNLSEAQAIADVATYVSELEWKPAGNNGDGELVAHGEQVYLRSCQSCHGATAEGAAEMLVPRLAGQHYGYVLREMHDAVEGRRPNFSLRHIRLLQKLDRDDFVGLADFLSRADPAHEVVRRHGST
jgi:cytochrome c553